MTNAIVLAGGRLDRRFPGAPGVEVKALLTINEETLLAKVLAALSGSPPVRRIAVVGPPQVRELGMALGADQFIAERGSGPDNIAAGLERVGDAEHLLVASSDMPFVLPQDVDDIVRLGADDADFCYAIIERRNFVAMYPAGNRVFIPLRDGRFVGGGIIKTRPDGLRAIEPHLRRVFEARKSPLAMARLLGTNILIRGILSILTGGRLGPSSDELRRVMEGITGRRGAIVRGCSPRIAFDIDTENDWRFAAGIAAPGTRAAP